MHPDVGIFKSTFIERLVPTIVLQIADYDANLQM